MSSNDLLAKAKIIKDWLVDIRRDFHQNPEFGMEEYRTQKKVISYLDEMGIENYKVANTGVVGIIRGSKPGKTVGLRADMDALPIEDLKEVPYKSTKPGKMHACGHDAHMTILLGAAKILNGIKENLPGNIKLFFQPAEETVGGAKPMIDAGVMENPKVDAVFGLHVSTEIPVGEIAVRYGQMNASSDTIKINLYGKSSHGAYPHNGIDAIMLSSHVLSALQTVVSRSVDPRKSAVVTLGTIKGGTQGNIIADKVELVGTVRTLDPQTRELVLGKVDKIVRQVSESLGGKGELIREEGYAALINTDEIVDIVRASGAQILGDEKIGFIKNASLGVEDFSYFAQAVPSAFFNLGCRNEDKGVVHQAHFGLFDIDEECLVIGTALQVSNVIKFLD